MAQASSPSILAPEVFEACRRKLGIAHRGLDILVSKVGLQRPRVVAGVGQGVAAGVAQHVRMSRSTILAKPRGGERRAALTDEQERRCDGNGLESDPHQWVLEWIGPTRTRG
jgi:hypothetical protein